MIIEVRILPFKFGCFKPASLINIYISHGYKASRWITFYNRIIIIWHTRVLYDSILNLKLIIDFGK